MTVQTREAFDRELAGLRDDLLRMGALVEEAVRRSVEALRSRSVEGAEAVIAADNAIDALHLELEERCLMLMATQQPMAKDLRTIAAVWAMTMDLERIGDHAEDIARATKRMADQPLLKPLIDIPRMAEMVQQMLRTGLDAFVQRDVNLAQQMAAADDEVDHLYGQVFRELLTYMIEDPHNIQRATHLLFSAQALERMGDHATNIAERVIYMVTGTLKELNLSAVSPPAAGGGPPAGPGSRKEALRAAGNEILPCLRRTADASPKSIRTSSQHSPATSSASTRPTPVSCPPGTRPRRRRTSRAYCARPGSNPRSTGACPSAATSSRA